MLSMRYVQNLHTHTTFCDGVDTPEEMVQIAIDKGFESIGFSGHAPRPFSIYSHITPETTLEYAREVRRLKDAYRGKLEIFLGLEADPNYTEVDVDWDYMIGSVHYVNVEGDLVGFDRSAETVREILNTYFDGDGMAFAKRYYEDLARMPDRGGFDIIGHFDIITKNVELLPFLDMNNPEYIRYAADAMDAMQGKIPFFEVNTGAMSRGYRTSPYPSALLLRELNARGFGAVISSDCHDGRKLAYGFEEAAELLEFCGFRERYILTESGFRAVGLKE